MVGQLEVGDLVCRGAHEVGVEAALDGQVRNHDAGLPLPLQLDDQGPDLREEGCVCVCVRAREGGGLDDATTAWVDRPTN